MNLWTETKIAAEIGVVAAERCAPGVAAASKHLVEEAMAQIFKKPTTLGKALPQISEAFSARNLQHAGAEVLDYLPTISQSVIGNKRLAEMKVTRLLGTGAHELVLATESKSALKLGVDAIPRPIPHKLFDAPVLEHGNLDQGVRYYTQALGETAGVTDKHVVSVVGKIRKAGFVEDDMWTFAGTRKDQVALFGKEQKPLLIDQGAAIPRYGTTFKNGELVPHLEQQANLKEISEFLSERRIELIKQSLTRPVNPMHNDGRSFSTKLEDFQIADSVKDFMKMIDGPPTMARHWTDSEIMHALRSISMGK